MATQNPTHGSRLSVVPDPPPFDEDAETRAAWNEIAAGFERALELLSPGHRHRPEIVAAHRDACFVAGRDPLTLR